MTPGTQFCMLISLETEVLSHYIAGDPVLYGDDLRSALLSDWAAAGKKMEWDGYNGWHTLTVVTCK
jgi:hypothetical protein